MEISVHRSRFAKELQLVQGIVERKSSVPILSNVLVEAKNGVLQISATDLDVSLLCGCEAEVRKVGGVTLPARKLHEIVRSLPDSELTLVTEKDAWTTIRCERSEFRVPGLPADDFPALPDAGAVRGATISTAALRSLIQRTIFAVTAEDARYYLAGALLVVEPQGLVMVATDGHRLAWARRGSDTQQAAADRVLVPRKALTELVKLMDEVDSDASLTFRRTESHLLFEVGGRTLASKMVEAQFPAFEKVIAVSGDKKLFVSREPLLAAIRRVSLLSSERGRGVRLALEPSSLEVSASSAELGEARETVAVEYSGESTAIGFNAQYLVDFLQVAAADQIHVELRDAESQGVFRPADVDGGEYRYVVMPMRF